MKKQYLRLPARRTYSFWNFDILIFPTSKQLLSKFLRKNLQVLKKILKVLIKFCGFTNFYDLKFLHNETTTLPLFLKICMRKPFASQILSNEWNIKVSILLIFLKCIVGGYSNGNKSFIGRLFSNYGPLNMLFHFFRYLIYSVFTGLLSKGLWIKNPFSAQISKIHFKM